MDWLWLFLSILGLGILWLAIWGIERLTERLKVHDEERRRMDQIIAQRTAKAEAEFLEQQAAKEDARAYLENVDFDKNNPVHVEMLHEALQTLSSTEVVESMVKRVFGNPVGTEEITAKQSAFDQVSSKKAVAKGDGVMPVKVKPSTRSTLSKSEQKMLKKIKQGD